MAVIDVRAHGAVGDGETDDHGAVLAAVRAAHTAGGGTVFFPSGTYAISAPIGPGSGEFASVCLVGDGDRASRILATTDITPITGRWVQCRLENLVIDAGSHGSAGLVVDLDKSYLRHCWVRNWTDYGIALNPNSVGLLNWIDDNFVEQGDGIGINTTYRFYDSWIVNNNVGSTGPNLSVESGPVRILANHLDGSPHHNIELRGNKSLTIIGNICEGARREAIIYTMPAWLESDNPQVQIVGNNITNGGKDAPGRYPAIGVYSRDAQRRTSGFNITGNFFGCTDDDAGWSYAVDAEYVDNLAIAGNQWGERGFTVAATRVSGRDVGIAGNTSANLDGRLVATLTAPAAVATTTGDQVYFLTADADVTLPTAVGNTCRLTFKNLGGGLRRVSADAGEFIDNHTAVTLTPGESVELLSDGQQWWRL